VEGRIHTKSGGKIIKKYLEEVSVHRGYSEFTVGKGILWGRKQDAQESKNRKEKNS